MANDQSPIFNALHQLDQVLQGLDFAEGTRVVISDEGGRLRAALDAEFCEACPHDPSRTWVDDSFTTGKGAIKTTYHVGFVAGLCVLTADVQRPDEN